ncbi:MAG TPA: Crp/Fnr family transcriptional regulator [Pyrinomonadaceae bacterium]|jgi:CRP-like cAMP-binding protein
MMPEQEIQSKAGNRLLGKLPDEELELLRPHLETVSLGHGHTLIQPQEPIPYIYFPINALASLVTLLEDGSTVEAGSVGREGMVGVPVLLEAATTPMQTLIQIPGDLIRVKASVLKEVFDRGGALHTLMHRYIHTLFVVASQSAACNRRHHVDARLARWLLMSSDGIASNRLALTQEFLAAMLGVRRSGVTEAAIKLQSMNLIHYYRGYVEILDREGLEQFTCECYRMVKDEYDRLLH